MRSVPFATALRLLSAACAALLAAACAGTPAAFPEPAPDPLAGRVFESADAREIARDALLGRLAEADVVYLGETHDNPRHQEIQREVVAALLARGRRPTIALEMISSDQTGYLMDYSRGSNGDSMARVKPMSTERLRERLAWDGARDYQWERYGPLLEMARSRQLPALGIDLPPALRLRLQRVGRDGLTPVEARQLPPTAPRDPAYVELMLERFQGAHCGFGSAAGRRRLLDTWIARNDAMAEAIVAASDLADFRPVVVVVGAGHLEHGHGVPGRVAELRPSLRQERIGLREVAPQPEPLAAYLEPTRFAGVDFGPAHQYVWLTRRQEREDPCEQFREVLRKRHGAQHDPDGKAAEDDGRAGGNSE